MSQILRPDGDTGQDDGWVPEPSDTSLWDTMDEADFNDGDYAWHNAVVQLDYFEVSLSNPPSGDPGTGEGTIRWRMGRIDGAQTAYLNIRLYTDTLLRHTGTLRTLGGFTTYTETVSQAEMDSVSDWNTCELRIVCTGTSGGGKASDPAVSWAEFEIPDVAGAPTYIPKVIGPF